MKQSVDFDSLTEKYLGLPTIVGQTKEGCFKYVREKSSAKGDGWKGEGMSKKRREVLVKSILPETPTYAMSCFRFSKKLCRNLTTISSKFWWGADNGKHKVHWVSWEKMYMNICMGACGLEILKSLTKLY